jgi:hypothetical protein
LFLFLQYPAKQLIQVEPQWAAKVETDLVIVFLSCKLEVEQYINLLQGDRALVAMLARLATQAMLALLVLLVILVILVVLDQGEHWETPVIPVEQDQQVMQDQQAPLEIQALMVTQAPLEITVLQALLGPMVMLVL